MLNDPTVHPGESQPGVKRNYSIYTKPIPVKVPSDPTIRKSEAVETELPSRPDIWKNNYMTVYPNASHTYGNALASIEQFIIDLFPLNTFKSINTALSTSNQQLRSTPRQLIKKRFPMLVSKARIDFGQDGDRSMAHTLLTERMSDFQMGWGLTNLQPMIYDRTCDLKLDWFLNKWVMNVDFILAFNTVNEQINMMNYFQNAVSIGHPMILNRPLETVIPRQIINEISYISGRPVYDDNGSVGPFLQYLQSISEDPITYKLKSGSGNDEFFRYYRAEMDTIISPPDHDEGQRTGQTNRLYEITFTVRTEFNGVGYFFLSSPWIRYKSNKPIFDNDNQEDAVICHYTDDLDYRLIQIPDGWCVLATPSIRFSSYDDREIDFRPILDERIERTIRFFLDHGMDPSLFLSFQFRKRSCVIKLKEDWYIDWNKRCIVMKEVDLHETYRMLVLVDNNLLNNYDKAMWGVQ